MQCGITKVRHYCKPPPGSGRGFGIIGGWIQVDNDQKWRGIYCNFVKFPVDGGDAIMISLRVSKRGVYSANGIATGKRI